MNQRLLVIFGCQNAGKSTTIKILYKKMLEVASHELNKRNCNLPKDVDDNNILVQHSGDVFSILKINDIKIALIGHGDYPSVLEKELNDIDVQECDFVVCCCRYKYNENSTNKLLQDKYGDQVIKWYYLERAYDIPGKIKNETKIANEIYDDLMYLISMKTKFKRRYIICDVNAKGRGKHNALLALISYLSRYNKPCFNFSNRTDAYVQYIIGGLKIAVFTQSEINESHKGYFIRADQWGANVIVCPTLSKDESVYHVYGQDDNGNPLGTQTYDDIIWLSNPFSDKGLTDAIADKLNHSFAVEIVDIIEQLFDMDICYAKPCIVDSLIVEKEPNSRSIPDSSLFEFLTYKKIPGTHSEYRLDKGTGEPGKLDHIHVFQNGKQIFAVNSDGSKHDGTSYKLSRKQIKSLKPIFKDLKFTMPDDGVIQCITI